MKPLSLATRNLYQGVGKRGRWGSGRIGEAKASWRRQEVLPPHSPSSLHHCCQGNFECATTTLRTQVAATWCWQRRMEGTHPSAAERTKEEERLFVRYTLLWFFFSGCGEKRTQITTEGMQNTMQQERNRSKEEIVARKCTWPALIIPRLQKGEMGRPRGEEGYKTTPREK